MRLGKVTIFPIKSLDGINLTESSITVGGSLEHDREFAIFDSEAKVVNGKRTPRVHALRSRFDGGIKEVQLWEEDGAAPEQFALDAPVVTSRWLSDFFGFQVSLERNSKSGFPDDLTAFGPTVVSEASLARVASWYGGLELDGVRRRFRSNLELIDGPPFCEDALFGEPNQLKPFRIGLVSLIGHNPCQRCVVPARDPVNGIVTAKFQQKFMELRRHELPAWSNAQRFNHFYRFAVNTSIPVSETGKRLRVGDEVFI
jgi:uncharacterized protein YcbX